MVSHHEVMLNSGRRDADNQCSVQQAPAELLPFLVPWVDGSLKSRNADSAGAADKSKYATHAPASTSVTTGRQVSAPARSSATPRSAQQGAFLGAGGRLDQRCQARGVACSSDARGGSPDTRQQRRSERQCPIKRLLSSRQAPAPPHGTLRAMSDDDELLPFLVPWVDGSLESHIRWGNTTMPVCRSDLVGPHRLSSNPHRGGLCHRCKEHLWQWTVRWQERDTLKGSDPTSPRAG